MMGETGWVYITASQSEEGSSETASGCNHHETLYDVLGVAKVRNAVYGTCPHAAHVARFYRCGLRDLCCMCAGSARPLTDLHHIIHLEEDDSPYFML